MHGQPPFAAKRAAVTASWPLAARPGAVSADVRGELTDRADGRVRCADRRRGARAVAFQTTKNFTNLDIAEPGGEWAASPSRR